MTERVRRRATYQDVLDAPEHLTAEILDGELRLSPRPKGPHTAAHSRLSHVLGGPFDLGNGGPGGWRILVEPEIHLGDNVVVPDLAGWRIARMSQVPAGYSTIAPDWVCEVLSPSTAATDRARKLPIYARFGVDHVWLVDAKQRTIEVLRRQETRWLLVDVHVGDVRVRAEPFDAVELDVSQLWAMIDPGTRASDGRPEYEYQYQYAPPLP